MRITVNVTEACVTLCKVGGSKLSALFKKTPESGAKE